MAILAALPTLGVMVILQVAIASRIPLLHGTADLVLLALLAWSVQERVRTAWYWSIIGGLLVSLLSVVPQGVYLVGYMAATGIALAFRHRVWRVPLLAMIIATFFGTLILHTLGILALNFTGTQIPWVESFYQITLPSALLNLLLAAPMYAVIGDLAGWIYPEEIEL
jgi:rod shape-determining protein MreD